VNDGDEAPVLTAAAFASGGGTNFQALLDHRPERPAWRMGLLISNRPTAGALTRAETAGLPTAVIPTKDRDAAEVGRDTLIALEAHGVDVIFLCGYLRLLPEAVVVRFAGRILNIHPALLPSFGGKGMYGMNVHRAVVASGARVTGATVHVADARYDQGGIIAQWPVPVRAGDTPEDVAARVLDIEHRLYPRAADHVCAALAAGRTPGPMPFDGDAFEVVKRHEVTDQNKGPTP
jgi:phosphoribosylglycinamide formyltransferase 1